MGRYYNSGIGKGIGTSPQTTLQNQVYENKVKEIEDNENSKNINVETNDAKQLMRIIFLLKLVKINMRSIYLFWTMKLEDLKLYS